MQFVKVNLNDIVYDKQQEVKGKVTFIDFATKLAKVEVIIDKNEEEGTRTTKLVECKLYNLVVIEKAKKNKSNQSKNSSLNIKVKYFDEELEKLSNISIGDWTDLRSAVSVNLKAGEFALIPLGVGMKLPDGYEANIVPRSSTFKNYGIIQTNHFAVIDNSYSGNEDEWKLPVYATRDTTINFNDRICQFRINRKMPSVNFVEVEELDEVSRGGFGTTGVK